MKAANTDFEALQNKLRALANRVKISDKPFKKLEDYGQFAFSQENLLNVKRQNYYGGSAPLHSSIYTQALQMLLIDIGHQIGQRIVMRGTNEQS